MFTSPDGGPMNAKHLTIFAGHYGSGKTQLAVNYALHLRKSRPVTLVDLDIVNPYFRTKDSETRLQEAGVGFISSAYANSNLDVPSVSAQVNCVFEDGETAFVIDVGGDERGALALGRYKGRMPEDRDVFLVYNHYRPQSAQWQDALEIVREIENAARVPFTGILHNSNLGAHTTARDVLAAVPYAETLSEKTGLPIVFTAVMESLCPELVGQIESLFPVTLFHKPQWVL